MLLAPYLHPDKTMVTHPLEPVSVPFGDAQDALLKALANEPPDIDLSSSRPGVGGPSPVKTQSVGLINTRLASRGSHISSFTWESAATSTWLRYLLALAQSVGLVGFSAIQLNDGFPALPHQDKGNVGLSFAISFGNYSGGDLCIKLGEEETAKFRTDAEGVLFDGACTHWVDPFGGRRASAVFFEASRAIDAVPCDVRALCSLGFPWDTEGVRLLQALPPSLHFEDSSGYSVCIPSRERATIVTTTHPQCPG